MPDFLKLGIELSLNYLQSPDVIVHCLGVLVNFSKSHYNTGMKLIKKLWGAGNTLYYPGCLTKFAAPELQKKYEAILRAEGIDFVQFQDEGFCCGSPVKNSGAGDDFRSLAQKNLEFFAQRSIGRIISNCPSCTAVFKIDYQKILGEKWDIEVLHVSEVISKALANLKKVEKGKKAVFHDPCHLGRVLGIFDQPRAIIRSAGYELAEMELAREKSFCCGAGGGVRSNEPELSGRIGKDRTGQAKNAGADVLITNCPMCWKQLKENAPQGLEVLELAELFEDA